MSQAGTITLEQSDGMPIALPTLWQNGPVLLFFMRQLGCGLCRQQLLRLRDQQARFGEAGCTIGVIVMGDGKMAHGLHELYNLPFPVYADPFMLAYEAFDIGETSLWNVAGPQIIVRQIGTALQGLKPSWGTGSIKQLGGLVIVDQAGTVLYRHVASPIYRYPPWDEVLAALPSEQEMGNSSYDINLSSVAASGRQNFQ